MAIKRYDAESHVGVEYNGTSFSVAEMVESEEGGYVHYQDYQQLELKNTELMAQVDLANKKIKSCMGLRWSSDIKEKLKEITDATPNQCLNQIKADALVTEAMLWPEDKYTECSHVRESILESAKRIQRGE
jgi:hypothetical protein